jgi:hypothetical protein
VTSAELRGHAVLATPLLIWGALGPAAGPRTLAAWAAATVAAALVLAGTPAPGTRWTLLLWLYATPVLRLVREEPSLAYGLGLLAAAAGLRLAARDGAGRVRGPAMAALGAVLGLALALGGAARGLALQPPDPLAALFSSREGLLFHWPVLWAGLLGLGLRAVPSAARRGALAGLLVLLPAAAVLAPRLRFAAALLALPFLAPGLAATVRAVRELAAARPLLPLAAAGALLVLWNQLFMHQYRDGSVPRDDTVAFPEVAAGSARLLAAGVGSPNAWPANWLFARRHGLPAARYDLMAGKELPARGARLELDVGRLDLDDALLAEGWSVRHPCGGEVCRAVEGEARAFLPLPDGRWAALAVAASGGGLAVRVNGREAGSAASGAGVLPTPAGLWRRGLNEVVLRATAGPVLVDRLAVERALP